MAETPDLLVHDLGHLGLVASILDRIGLVSLVDGWVGPRPGEKVSTGVALKAAVLNALGFLGHFWDKTFLPTSYPLSGGPS